MSGLLSTGAPWPSGLQRSTTRVSGLLPTGARWPSGLELYDEGIWALVYRGAVAEWGYSGQRRGCLGSCLQGRGGRVG